MGFAEDLARHAEQIKSRVAHIKGEEATKHALVVPFLQVLGYDVFDPRQVQPEYVADFAKKKAGQFEKIDYAVWLEEAPQIFIECKPIGGVLADHDGQLGRYFNATPSVKVAMLTDGVRLRVFGDLQQPNIMDTTPWLDVDLTALKPAEIEALRRFRKVDFSSDEIVALAEEMVYFNSMVSFLAVQLREPTETFVRFVAGEISTAGRVTQKVVERLAPILRKAIQTAILDHVARSFERAADPHPTTSDLPPAPPKAMPNDAPIAVQSIDAVPEGRAGIVTTAEELQCWEQIKELIQEVNSGAPLGYRDAKAYFTIYQTGLRKWFLRLNATKAPFWMTFRGMSVDELRKLAPGMEVSEAREGASRITLKNLGEIAKMRTAILAAYDRETNRSGDEGDALSEEPATANVIN
jgi:hypothetical protein